MKEPLSRTKVVVRRLPPTLSQPDFSQQIDDRFSGRYHWLRYTPGKNSLKNQRHSRAYLDFNRPEDVIEFAEFFDGHVFVNEKGVQYKTLVEYAPYQRAPKQSSRKDGREGTIFKDFEYLEFLKIIAKPVEHLPSAEIQLERKEAEQAGSSKEPPIVTPLMEYIRQKRSAEGGVQGSIIIRKINRRSNVTSSRKPGSSATKRASEKKKYIMKDKSKSSNRKDKSTFTVVPRHEDQLGTSSGKEVFDSEIGAGDSGKKKILLLKGKRPEAQQQDTSIGSSPISAPPKHSQKREGNGKLIRSILSNNETRQAQTPSLVQPQQKTPTPNSENLKRVPRPPNVRSALNGHVSHKEIEGDRSKDVDDKFAKKDAHNMSNISEKQEKRTRNKDRPDRGVWAPLRRADVSTTSDERISALLSQPTQQLIDPAEGSQRNFGRRGMTNIIKEEGTQNVSEVKVSKRGGGSVHTAHEKQVWVQKSSAGP